MLVRDHTMETRESAAKATAEEVSEALEDRISDLPDPILHQIMSSSPLTSRDIVLVSMLSKRWRNLWKSSPFLDLDDSCFVDDEDDEEEKESFGRFVDTLLLLRNGSDMHSFCLSWFMDLHPHGQRHLYEWVQHAVRRNVRVIELNFQVYEKEVDLPRSMFNCESLEELSVMFHRMIQLRIPKIELPQKVWLPSLYRLHLKRVEIDHGSMEKLILGCHGLEELVFEDCWLISVILLFKRLKVLTIKGCCIGGDGFSISCPGLQSLCFVGNFIDVRYVYFHNVSSVVSATVLVDSEGQRKRQLEYEGSYFGNTLDFVIGLANAETLGIISSRVQLIPEELLLVFPSFPNLKNLTLGGWKMAEKFQMVAHFIKRSPKLESLTLTSAEENEGEASQKTEQIWFHCPGNVIACKIQCGEDNERLLDLVNKVIVSTYTLPDRKVRIVPRNRIQDLSNC